MKNLKKVLALVMVFAMMATAMLSAAAFTDDADIEAKEAVNTLSALGVINGYEDGSFKPNGTVTRAEMAAMLYIIRNGGKTDASGYANLPSSFTDLGQASWAAGYIKHAQTMGIISGRTDTVFDPNAPVTGVEAALMCLRTAGYDASKAGIGGATWMSTTLSMANEAGLLDGVQADLYGALPRQWAAQMLYNLLDTSTVRWSNDSESFTDLDMGGNSLDTVGEKYMGYSTLTGILVETNNGEGKGFGILRQHTDGTYNWSDSTWTENKYTTDLTQFLGEEVKVAYDSSEYSKNNDSVFGVFATDNNTVLVSSRNKVKMTSSSDKVKVDGTEYKITSDSKYITTTAVNSLLDDIKTQYGTAKEISQLPTADVNEGTTVKFVDYNNDNKFDLAIEFPMAVGEISTVSSSKVTLKSITTGNTLSTKTFDLDDNIVYDGIAKGDLVKVTYDYFNDAYVIEKADATTGTITATRSGEYRIGDTWAKAAASYTNMPTLKAGDTVKSVVINGIIYYCDKTKGTTGTDVAMVVNTGSRNGGADGDDVQAKLMFMDGSTKTVIVDKVIKNDTDATEADVTTVGQLDKYLDDGTINDTTQNAYSSEQGTKNTKGPALVTYSVDNNDEYTLQLVDGSHNDADYDAVACYDAVKDSANAQIASGNNTIKYIGNYEIADDAVVLVAYGTSDAKKLTGKEVKRIIGVTTTLKNTGSAMVSKESGYSYAKVVALTFLAKPAISSGADYGYLLSNAYVGFDKFTYFDIWTSEGRKSVKWDNNTSTSALNAYKEKAVITFDWDDADVIKNVAPVSMTSGAVTAYDGDEKIAFVSETGVVEPNTEIDKDDTVILYVDTDTLDNNTGATNDGTIEMNEVIKDAVYNANAMYAKSGNKWGVIVYDVNGNLNGSDKLCLVSSSINSANLTDVLTEAGKATVAVSNITANATVPAETTLTISDEADLATIKFLKPEEGAKLTLTAESASLGTDATIENAIKDVIEIDGTYTPGTASNKIKAGTTLTGTSDGKWTVAASALAPANN